MAVREFLVTKVIRLFHLPAGNWQAGRLLKIFGQSQRLFPHSSDNLVCTGKEQN